MNPSHFDLIVLGSGPAEGTVATEIAGQGRKVAVIESRQFGGTCALRGCNPKKVFANAAECVDRVRRADGLLVQDGGVAIDWPTLVSFAKQFTEPVARHKRSSFEDEGITTILGSPHFTGSRTLVVNDQYFKADRILIATGAEPFPLPFEGGEHATLSDEFMTLDRLPNRIVFIGGGYISMEFAHVAARCRRTVTVIEEGSRVLDAFDPQLTKNLFASTPEAKPDYGNVPQVAFTTPSIASVGLSEDEAKKKHENIEVYFDDVSTWGSVRKTGNTVAGYKILVDPSTDLILGAHLLGPESEETINLFAMAMKFGITATNVKSTLFAYPTFAAEVRRML